MPASEKGIDLDSMSLEQLNSLKQTEESRMNAITSHYATLRATAARMSSAKKALSEITPAKSDAEILVPLTESLYVPGKIVDPGRVMVELGTGFYAERGAKDAQSFIERKAKLVEANSENVMEAIAGTRRNIESITGAMQGKMLQIRARQEGARHRMEVEGNA